jgi:hypothetical protein
VAKDFSAVDYLCKKAYLARNGWVDSAMPEIVVPAKVYREVPSPVDATSITISWNLQEKPDGQNDLTRYIISVERDVGCKLIPMVKFQVPTLQACVNDCEQVAKSKLMGTTQPFPVKVCAGDLLALSVTRILAEDCPSHCGVPVESNPAATDATKLDVALISVYLL